MLAALAAWLARWAARELAPHVARRYPPAAPAPKDSLRPAGYMPGRFD